MKNIEYILNDCLNKAMCQKGRIQHPNSNNIADFVSKYLQKEKLTLTDVVDCVYVVTETDNYGRQLFRDVFLNKAQANEYLKKDGLKEDNINEINEIDLY